MEITQENYLREHLSAAWLRPESALWDAVASTHIAQNLTGSPSLDLGCGNGIFSFITAGGKFSLDYDWYKNVDKNDFWKNEDVYDVYYTGPLEKDILRKPTYKFSYGLDHKKSLLRQAEGLGLYENLIEHDANQTLPFPNETFETVFSNILYWLKDINFSLNEIARVLKPGGKAILCLPSEKFYEYCPSYHWEDKKDVLLERLNRGRSKCMHVTFIREEFDKLSNQAGFKVERCVSYLSPLTLKVWDIGLRPLFPVLIKMVQKFDNESRLEIKQEWVENVFPFMEQLFKLELAKKEPGGFNLFVLEKR